MVSPLRIGIAGLGTVGAATAAILSEQSEMLAARCGRPLIIAAVSARDKNKKRGCDIKKLRWVDDPLTMAADKKIDVIVETIGGEGGIAKALVEKALKNGKPVVTANKALLAHHGLALAKLAEKHDVTIAFEAAVGGGIPIIKALREGLSANNIVRIGGILNGACNYILTAMTERRSAFAAALKEAQDKGYAEADPSFDIDGLDTAHKLAVLSALAYGMVPDLQSMHVEGIRSVTASDIAFADDLGYVIKLLGIATLSKHGVLQRVHPCLIAKPSPLASVRGALNAITVKGDAAGNVFFEGAGAGACPSASSVVADIVDIARGAHYKPFTLPLSALKSPKLAAMDTLHASYYVRLSVADRPGVLAEITGVLKYASISLKSILQPPSPEDKTAQVVLVTHETGETAMQKALAMMAKLDCVKNKPCMIRIEAL